MKPWRLWWTCPVLIFCGILFPGLARADDITPAEREWARQHWPLVCDTITETPTIAGVIGTGWGIQIVAGVSIDSAVNIVNYAVANFCPRFGPLLDRAGDWQRQQERKQQKQIPVTLASQQAV